MQESLTNHMAQVRQSIDEKKGQLDAKHAESRADDAEVDALFAIDYAYASSCGLRRRQGSSEAQTTSAVLRAHRSDT